MREKIEVLERRAAQMEELNQSDATGGCQGRFSGSWPTVRNHQYEKIPGLGEGEEGVVSE